MAGALFLNMSVSSLLFLCQMGSERCTILMEMFTRELGRMANVTARCFESRDRFLARSFSLTTSCYISSQASVYYSNGDVFEGQFVGGHIEGHGKLTCGNGVEYVGEWKRSHVSLCGNPGNTVEQY